MAWKVDGNEDFYISTCRELYKQYNGANKCQISATETVKKNFKVWHPFWVLWLCFKHGFKALMYTFLFTVCFEMQGV